MAVHALVLSARDMDPIVSTIGGLHNQLIEVGVMLQEVEPLLGELHVGVVLVVVPIRVGVKRYMDVSSFTKGVL